MSPLLRYVLRRKSSIHLHIYTTIYSLYTYMQYLIELIRVPAFAVSITVDQWHKLAWALLHESASVRSRLLTSLQNVLNTTPVHLKFLAYPCVLANDEVLGSKAEAILSFVIRRMRATHENLITAELAVNDERERDGIRLKAEAGMPENLLPYVLHIISYHPDFPTSTTIETEEDKKLMVNVMKLVRMVLKVLNTSLQSNADNTSFLMKQLHLVLQSSDAHDPENFGLQFVATMASKILNEQIRTSDNVQVYRGDIRLPFELYSKKYGEGEGGKDGGVPNQQEGLAEAVQTINKVLKIKGSKGGKGGKGVGGGRKTAPILDARKSYAMKVAPSRGGKGKGVRRKESWAEEVEEEDEDDEEEERESEEEEEEEEGEGSKRTKKKSTTPLKSSKQKQAKVEDMRRPSEEPTRRMAGRQAKVSHPLYTVLQFLSSHNVHTVHTMHTVHAHKPYHPNPRPLLMALYGLILSYPIGKSGLLLRKGCY